MKSYLLITIFICLIHNIYGFSQSQLPKDVIIVAKDGSGNFDTIQEAVDALPKKADSERIIFIKNGTYREQVTIKKDYVTFIGEDKENVLITYDLNNNKTGSSSECATVRANCNHFKAFDISFENTAPFPGSNAQAPAFYSKGEKHYIENCKFYSYQDTLLSYAGSQYFKNCFIQGLTDFIWGSGRAVFENCHLNVVAKEKKKKGYLTANGNEDENFEKGGFLITQSKVTSEVATFYLGRTWRPYCYVIFDRVTFPGKKIIADGWLPFKNYEHYAETSKVGEYQCRGEDYSTEGRVSWQTVFDSVPSIEEFLGGDLSFVSETVYNKKNDSDTGNEVSTENCQNDLYFQCGGINFKGSNCCKEGKCVYINEWYSYCDKQ
eukprot:jgi/Orpsp1_1/1180209/evm.model.c7180000072520.1